MKNILELNNNEAKAFFCKGVSYSNIDFPHYFDFDKIITEIYKEVSRKKIDDCCRQTPKANGKRGTLSDMPSNYEKVCYQLLTNKDGKYSWRPLQLIHPVLYCLLVKEITELNNWNFIKGRFLEFSTNKKIECLSIPKEATIQKTDKAENIMSWWNGMEQQSIKLSLKYDYVLISDITDCYGAIYTHSIPWALHTIPVAKQNRAADSLLGNKIDLLIREMRYGQTNGIPQGSVLMDFIAEMILGYVDKELSSKLEIKDIKEYKILRYRDDYRIFSNNMYELEIIAKLLTETLSEVGLKLNSNKTHLSADVIKDSLKPDKFYYISNTPIYAGNRHSLFSTVQHELLFIHDISTKYPNSGILSKLLTTTYKNRVLKITKTKEDINVLISIVVDLIYKNPRIYSIGFAIISKLMTLMEDQDSAKISLTDILEKFRKTPNTGHMQIWLQRIAIPINSELAFSEPICKLVAGDISDLWDSTWLHPKLKTKLSSLDFILKEKMVELSPVLDLSEISVFEYEDSLKPIEDNAN